MHINITFSKYCCGSRDGVEEDWAGWNWAIRLLGRFPLQASSRQSKLLWIRLVFSRERVLTPNGWKCQPTFRTLTDYRLRKRNCCLSNALLFV